MKRLWRFLEEDHHTKMSGLDESMLSFADNPALNQQQFASVRPRNLRPDEYEQRGAGASAQDLEGWWRNAQRAG